MLHIILGILKIIGVTAGILLLLLLAVIFALVAVPVRYRLTAVRKLGRMEASLRASWLLHLVSVTAAAGASDGRTVVIRLFGIPLPLFGAGRARKETSAGKKAGQRQPEGPVRSVEVGKEPAGNENAEERGRESPEREDPDPGDGLKDTGEPEPKKAILEKAAFQYRRIYDKIRKLFQTVKSLGQKLAGLRQSAANLCRRIAGLLRKPGELMEFAEEYEAAEVFGGLAGHLLYLIGHYKPRRIEGYLRFGTGDPASTGQLTGLVYFFLPARADRFEVTPEFNEKMFETEVICSGHIRALHVLRVLLRGIRDRKLRRLIKKLRERGES